MKIAVRGTSLNTQITQLAVSPKGVKSAFDPCSNLLRVKGRLDPFSQRQT